MTVTSTGAGDLANVLLPELVSGVDFSFPVIDLNDPSFTYTPEEGDPIFDAITKLQNSDLTSGIVGGTGTFDVIMTSMRSHLLSEYEKNRITGNDYVTAYIGLSQVALSSAVSFLLQRDTAFYQAALAKAAAMKAEVDVVTSKVALALAKVQLATGQIQANTEEVNYALTKLKLATEDATYGAASEQMEAARAQTLDTRTDGGAVAGSVGKQKELYTQQITSYQRDAEVKAAKLYTDAWTVMKTIDEGLDPPTSFTNANLQTVLTHIQTNNNLS